MSSFTSPLLSGCRRLRHLFVGLLDEARPEPRALMEMLAGGPTRVALARLRQIHSNRSVRVDPATLSEGALAGEGDALVTSAPGVALGVATADCLALIAVDPDAPALAVVHAGWRGTLAGVLTQALKEMTEMGARPERIVIGAGPAAGACCYEVGVEVVSAFRNRYPTHAGRIVVEQGSGSTHLDLVEANRLQAIDAGVGAGRFESLGVCTICQPAVTHSYRRDGAEAGRMWALAELES